MAEQFVEAPVSPVLPVEDVNQIVTQILGMQRRAEAAAVAAEAALAGAEEANRKANSESGYAFNAKQYAEEHGKAIAQVRGTVEADFNWLTTTKKNADEAFAAIAAAKQSAESDARTTAESKTAAETAVATLKSAQEKGATCLTAAEKACDESTATAKRAAEEAATVAQNLANTQTAASNVQALQTQTADAAAKSQADASAIEARVNAATALWSTMSNVCETARTTQDRVDGYEADLKKLDADSKQLHDKIESLLPGATSAGLASAFRDQKARFDKPQLFWQITFIVAVLGLFAVGTWGAEKLVSEQLTWELLRIHVVSRLPLAIPLVWLAIFAGRSYTTALRLQEDYAYKEAISTAFEGYRREMSSLQISEEQAQPVLRFCENVLKTLGQRPGRLYDGKHEDVTPLTPAMSLFRAMGRRTMPEKDPEA